MLDVERGPLQALVHEAILASLSSPCADGGCQLSIQVHPGDLPRSCNALARTSDSRSLSSAKASNSSRSPSLKRPSLLRSISSCRRWSALEGKRRFPRDSIQSTDAAISESMRLKLKGRAFSVK